MSKRVVWGVLLVGFGLVFLLENIGLVDTYLSLWPVLLFLAGVFVCYGALSGRRGIEWFSLSLGIWLAAMGLFEVLSDAGVTPEIDAGWVASRGWPILLIGSGAGMLIRRGRDRGRGAPGGDSADEPTHQTLGDLRFGREPWVLDGDLDFSNSVGDLEVDLSTAQITPGVHRITVTQGMGESVIRVPDDVTVRVTAEATAGELDVFGQQRSGTGLFLKSEVQVPDAPELEIDARVRVGTLRVVRVPAFRRGIG